MDRTIFELSEKLKHPSDVDNKIESIMNHCRELSINHDNKIKALCITELNDLKNISSRIASIKELVEHFESLKSEGSSIIENSEYALQNYDTIKTVALAHENFCITRKFLENLQSVEDIIEEEDLEKRHEIIYRKEEFMYDLQQYNYDLSVDDFKSVEGKINHLKKISYEFSALLLSIMTDFVDNCDAFDKVNRIVQREEQRDQLTIKAKEGESSEDPVSKQYYRQYLKYVQRDTKNLKRKITAVIKLSIENKFKSLKDDQEFLVKLDFIFEDLDKLQHTRLDFFSFNEFMINYHRSLKAFIGQKLQSMEPEDVLGVIEFKTTYYERMEGEFNKISEALGDRLIDNEPVLLEKYSAAASSKLKTWIVNIANTEIQKFVSRDREINKDEQGKLISPGFINLMHIIKVQLEPVAFSRKIFLFLTHEIKEQCQLFRDSIIRTIQQEFKLSIDNKALPGFEDYCIMFGNSGLKLTQYINSFDMGQEDEGKDLQNIFLGILKSSNSFLCDFIIHTCKPVIQKVFTTEWVESNHSEVLIATLEDFLQDYSKTMYDYSFMTFICALCEKLYKNYKNQLKSSKIALNKRAAKCLKKDHERISELLSGYTREEDFSEFLKPMIKFVLLLEGISGELFILELKSFILVDPKIERSLIENIIERKTDLAEKEKRFIILKLDEIFVQEKPKKKTFLNKILSG